LDLQTAQEIDNYYQKKMNEFAQDGPLTASVELRARQLTSRVFELRALKMVVPARTPNERTEQRRRFFQNFNERKAVLKKWCKKD
jgi:hypothetical protein